MEDELLELPWQINTLKLVDRVVFGTYKASYMN